MADATELEYRQAAADCLEAAKSVSTENVRSSLLALAYNWLALANHHLELGRSTAAKGEPAASEGQSRHDSESPGARA